MNDYPLKPETHNKPILTADTNIQPEGSKQPSESPEEQEAAHKEARNRRFLTLGIPGFLYAVFYTFCLYRNTSGITHPFFVAGTLYFYCYCLKKSGLPVKKDAIFYMAATVLLGISTFLTDDYRIIGMNKTGIFVLMIGFLLHHYYEDIKWGFMHYLYAICATILGTLGALFSPYLDFIAYCGKKGKEAKNYSKIISVIIGLSISIPLLVVIFALLSSADVIFDSIFTEYLWTYLQEIDFMKHLWGIFWSLAAGLLFGYSLFSFLGKKSIIQEDKNRRTREPIIAITFTLSLSAVYILFCTIQIAGLFLGNLKLPEGYTYSEYARQGFFQLLTVCLINLAIVLICLAFFRANKVLKVLLTVISSCTYIMIASSAVRMIMYIRYCYFTFLRIFVLWALLVIFLLITGVVVSIYREKFPLFRFSMIVVTVLYIGFSFSHPDYLIAKYNMQGRAVQNSTFFLGDEFQDEDYLFRLSADAAPILLDPNNIPEDLYVYDRYKEKVRDTKVTIRTFNVSRYIAQKMP